jgi:hypothetical protein
MIEFTISAQLLDLLCKAAIYIILGLMVMAGLLAYGLYAYPNNSQRPLLQRIIIILLLAGFYGVAVWGIVGISGIISRL